MSDKRMLIIGMVWPEPTSSAAGTRMIQLVTLFIDEGYAVFFASAASKSEFSFNLTEIGITELPITLNDASFDRLTAEINPSIVLFDRFMIEEQYGWRITETCPDALKILDTEDLHFLRRDRQHALNSTSNSKPLSDTAKREIASILRCDMSLIISEYEIQLLQDQYRIDATLLYYLPFLENKINQEHISAWRSFEDRTGFVFIGNFLHEPNWHTTQFIKTKIWPELRRKHPDAGMHIYGAYTSQKVTQLHNPKERFYVHGRAGHAQETIQQHRVLLAPIQFGAGVKGKFIDAMQTGTPSVTTDIGAESMSGKLPWPGAIENEPQRFIESAAKLYKDKASWMQAQQNGIRIINERYDSELFSKAFIAAVNILFAQLVTHRNQNFLGQILKMNTLNSSKYMALWIEEKNKNKTP
ncbi:glycosyltransferase [Pedobacter duraquae]|uniref:Glycosyltransferase involved in cell wall biosynthesis n=1 Tax=Pedobacter duraquae TaxID=425511 RepID=A0A4R6IQ89_9SPHI|nr:glycosyltransferase [Pedobacter duraquae]TDO24453.1 glycosyltransferase involved in cell wall biosynthesis [Pedobacter duraquae]